MRRFAFAVLMVTATPFSTSALAGCQTSTGPCSTDGYGNTYRTEQNLGGGYNTFRNGVLDSQTSQTTSGSWRERSTDGGTRTYNYNPYEGDGGTPGYR